MDKGFTAFDVNYSGCYKKKFCVDCLIKFVNVFVTRQKCNTREPSM